MDDKVEKDLYHFQVFGIGDWVFGAKN